MNFYFISRGGDTFTFSKLCEEWKEKFRGAPLPIIDVTLFLNSLLWPMLNVFEFEFQISVVALCSVDVNIEFKLTFPLFSHKFTITVADCFVNVIMLLPKDFVRDQLIRVYDWAFRDHVEYVRDQSMLQPPLNHMIKHPKS